jgi:8-oxo-dGTP diphosphatase
MDKTVDIHKAGGIILKDRRLLVVRTRFKDIFNTPGGKLEAGETAAAALVRELQEEININVDEADLDTFGTFYAQASGQTSKSIRMDVFTVKTWRGDIIAASEIEEVRWIDSSDSETIPLGSIFHHEVIPRMKKQSLID